MQIRGVGQITGFLSSLHRRLPRYLSNRSDALIYAIGKDTYHQLKGEELLSGDSYNIVLVDQLEVSFITNSNLHFIAYPDGYTTSVNQYERNVIKIEFFPPI